MANCYCKHCGHEESRVTLLVGKPCNRNPNGRQHELYEGSEKDEYTCKYCGNQQNRIKKLVGLPCNKNPNGKQHSPAL